MLKLRSIYVVCIPIGLALFHILYSKGAIPYTFINVVFLLTAPAAFFYHKGFPYLLASLSWFALYPIFVLIYKIDLLNAFLPIFIFNGLLIGFMTYKNMIEKDQKTRDSKLLEREGNKKTILEEFYKTAGFENGIKLKELAIVNLYEITKKMSEGLRLDDVFKVFSAFLKDNFIFRRCDLLILNPEGSDKRLGKTYSVWKEDGAKGAGSITNYDELIKQVLINPKEIYIQKFGESFAAMPLLSERKVVGILAVENLAREDLERFAIVSMQFALEIKKVLLYETVETLAITDSLTGLYVRRYFSERLYEEAQRSKRYKFSFSLLMIDIDDFKRCNDTYGHLVGDVILRDIAHIMKTNVREIDIVSRYGGEEFVILLPETGAEGAKLTAERLRKKTEENVFKAYDEKLKITISTGISVYPEDTAGASELIEKADMALYAAKRSGKNIVCGYKKEYNNP